MTVLAYDDAGNGPAVVFVHGFCSTRRAFGYQLLDLSTDHRVLAVDLPGFGASTFDPHRPWFDQAVDGVVAVIEEAGVDSPLLVGWSLGGSVVTAAAARVADARTVLVGASLAAADEKVRESIRASIARDFPRYATALVRQLAWNVSAETEHWLRDMALSTPVDVALSAVLSQPELEPVGHVATVLGRHDALVADAPGEVEWFDRSGHAPFIEEKDRFNAFIRTLARC